ncbi:MAG: WYL domain-containing protein, partial [Arcicella sp.]|nr:WYL domain-containing protein [Arcicella sp.]
MSKREALIRYSAIIKTLKKNPSTLKEIEQDLALQSELHEYNLKISKRTFQRDVEDI